MPACRQMSLTGTPASACLRIETIWGSVKRDFFMEPPGWGKHARKFYLWGVCGSGKLTAGPAEPGRCAAAGDGRVRDPEGPPVRDRGGRPRAQAGAVGGARAFESGNQAVFELLGPVRCAQVRAVAMDMNSAYDLEVRAHCPNAEVVYDLFHVVAKYGREVIDRVRVAYGYRDDAYFFLKIRAA